MDTETFLSSVKIFSKLSQDSLQMIAKHAQAMNYAKDDVIVEQGIHGKYLWVICQGSVKVIREFQDKERKVLAILASSDFFGEISLMSQKPTTAEIRAAEPTVVLRIPQDIVAPVVKKSLSANAFLSRISVERLTSSTNQQFRKE